MPNILSKPWQIAAASWQQVNWLPRLGLILTALSFFFLYPGVTEPIMTIKATINMFGLKSTIFEETRSIWQTVLSLKEAGYAEVGFMVVTFSIIIPVSKGLLILWTWLSPTRWRWQLISMMSKWSMADVFVVAIFVAFFTSQATAELQAELHNGFYWFTAYCFISIISGQCLANFTDQKKKRKSNKHKKEKVKEKKK